MSVAGSEPSYGVRDIDAPHRTLIAEMPLQVVSSTRKPKQMSPQEAIDEFWAKFTTKTPGKGAFRHSESTFSVPRPVRRQ
jgi:hypothetical protein